MVWCRMVWGVFGPVQFKTKRGTRVTFVAGFITLPLTCYSIYKLFQLKEQGNPKAVPEENHSSIDLSDK